MVLLVPDVWVFQKLLVFSHTAIFRVYRAAAVVCVKMPCWSEENDQNAQITTRCMQKSFSEWSTAAEDHIGCQSLLLRAENWLKFTQSHKQQTTGTIEDWKDVLCFVSSFLCWHSNNKVRIWCRQHESMDPSQLGSPVLDDGDVMVCWMFSWHPLVPLVVRLLH